MPPLNECCLSGTLRKRMSSPELICLDANEVFFSSGSLRRRMSMLVLFDFE